MSHPDSDQPSFPRSPLTAGALVLGVFIALSLAVGGLIHLAALVAAAEGIDAAQRSGSFDPPSSATSVHPSEPT